MYFFASLRFVRLYIFHAFMRFIIYSVVTLLSALLYIRGGRENRGVESCHH